jgi:hypothetical protein
LWNIGAIIPAASSGTALVLQHDTVLAGIAGSIREMDSDPNKSIWVDEWTDEQYKARYLFHTKEMYEQYKLYRNLSFQNHVEYAKWLVASLLAVHGGSIYAISSIRESVGQDQLIFLVGGAAWNLAGIVFTLITGLCAWLNFQFAESLFEDWADAAMMYRTDRTPRYKMDNRKTDPIGATHFAGAAFGVMSAYCFVVSAVTVVSALKSGLKIAGGS